MSQSVHIFEVSIENFQSDVVEKSKQVPVLVEFYAQGAEPSQQIAPVLQRLAESYAGKFVLARIDIQANQQLIQQLEVRTLPTLILIANGQMVSKLEGPQEETKIRELIDQVTMSSVERVREQLDLLLAQGNRKDAVSLLQQVIESEPNNYVLHVELCDLLILEDRGDEARQILESLPKDTQGISKPLNRLQFIEEATKFGSMQELMSKVSQEPANKESRFQLSIVQIANDDIEAALENLLEMLKQDREFGDDLARKTMIRVFDLLGKGNVLATDYRRKMFAHLH